MPYYVWLGIIGTLITILGFIRWVVQPMYRRMWPGREGWSVRYKHNSDVYMESDLQRILVRDNTSYWRSLFTQAVGDYYQIQLQKEMVIDGFCEIDIETDNQIPLEYSLRLYNKGKGKLGIKEGEPNNIAREPICGKGRVSTRFPPVKVQRIEVRIRKPNLDDNKQPYFWKIFGFELSEVMFFRHFVRRRV